MQIPVGFGQVTHIFGGAGYPEGAAVTYGFENVVAGSAAFWALQFHLSFGTDIMPELTGTFSLLSTQVKLGPNTTGDQASYEEQINGGAAGEQATPNVTYLVTKRTELGGREGRGRMYLPGVQENAVDAGGAVTLAKQQSLATAFETWSTQFEGVIAANLVLLHNSATPPTEIVDWVPSSLAATQRRRLRR